MTTPVVVGVSGASGAILARHALEWLGAHGHPVILVVSEIGEQVWREELGEGPDAFLKRGRAQGWDIKRFGIQTLSAPIASGSFETIGMIVVPCSMSTVAAIAHGYSDNLLHRAADVTLKEHRPLVLVPRETPLSAIHLRNMLRLAEMGTHIVPPMPAFYNNPKTIEEMVEYLVARSLAALGLPNALSESQRYPTSAHKS